MKYTEEEEYAIGYYLDKEICAEIEIKDDKGEFLKALGINTEDSNFESHLIRFKTLLNLIEKQRKEIEKLKEHLNQYYDGKLFTANQLKATEKEQNKYFIHKDKIREKIKELNDNRPYLSKFDDWKEKEYTNEDVTNKCVEILDDLLGE